MSVFFIRVWVDGDSIVAVSTGQGLITNAGDYGNATFIDAVAEGAYVDAGTLRPTLTYANNVLSSSLVTLLPAKDVTALLAQSGYGGQAVYNWADGNQYQWNGAAWGATPLTSQAVTSISDQSFTENIATAIIPYDNFSQDVKDLFDGIAADIGQLNTETATLETDIASIAADLGQLTDDTVALEADVTTLQTDYTALDGTVTSNVSAISGLETRVTSAEGAITASASDITQLQSDLTTAEGNISGNATAISGLDTRVTSAEGAITASASDITQLQSDLTTAEGNISGNASAISGLDVRVTDNEGDISSQASAITSLSTTVGNNTTSVTEALTSIDGIEGKYGVTIDNNGSITGFQLLSGVGGSAFNVRADQFAVFNSTGGGGDNPFTIFTSSRTIDGVTYPAGTYIEDAFIDNAAIVTASIGTLKIGNNAATVADFAQYNPTINSALFEPGAGFSTAFSACSGSISIPANQTADIFIAFNLRHGYISEPTQWGYRIQGLLTGGSVQTLTSRTAMVATNDFPVITYLETVSPGATAKSYTVLGQWYGENSNIELQDATLSIVARYK